MPKEPPTEGELHPISGLYAIPEPDTVRSASIAIVLDFRPPPEPDVDPVPSRDPELPAMKLRIGARQGALLTILAGGVSGGLAGATLESWYGVAIGAAIGLAAGRWATRADGFATAGQH